MTDILGDILKSTKQNCSNELDKEYTETLRKTEHYIKCIYSGDGIAKLIVLLNRQPIRNWFKFGYHDRYVKWGEENNLKIILRDDEFFLDYVIYPLDEYNRLVSHTFWNRVRKFFSLPIKTNIVL